MCTVSTRLSNLSLGSKFWLLLAIVLSTAIAVACAETPPSKRSDVVIGKEQAELEKLRAETQALVIENTALDPNVPHWSVRQWSALSGVLGGLSGALVAFVVWLFSQRYQSSQQSKLDQDRQLEREKQTMELLRDL